MRRLIFTLTCILYASNLFSQDYFPLKVGNTWIFEELNNEGVIIGFDTTLIKDNYVVNSLNIFLMVESVTDSTGTNLQNTELFTDSINNSDIFFRIGDTNQKIWQHNYKDGDKWVFMDDSVHVKYIEQVNVPAGNFHDCFFVMTDSASGWIFAPNVGIVKTIVDNKARYVLTKYNVSTTNVSIITNEFCDYIKGSSIN